MQDDPKDSLTEWGNKLNSPDRSVREEAGERIVQAFDERLLRLIEKEIGDQLRGKVTPSSVFQSVFAGLLAKTPRFPNRNEMWGYIRKAAINKVKDRAKYHGRRRRDHHQETRPGAQATDGSNASDNILEHGQEVLEPELLKRNYRRREESGAML